MSSQREELDYRAEETRKYGAPAAIDTTATPAGWMVNHPDDFRLSADGQFLEWDKDSRRGNRRVLPDAQLLGRFVRFSSSRICPPQPVTEAARSAGAA